MTTANNSGPAPATLKEPSAYNMSAATRVSVSGPSTPEDCFSVPGDGVNINIVNACLSRANATISALMADGQEGEFTMNPHLILNGLWAAIGWIEMAQKAVNPAKPAAAQF